MNHYTAIFREVLVGKQVAHNYHLPEKLEEVQGEINKIGFNQQLLKVQMVWVYGREKSYRVSHSIPASLRNFEAAMHNRLVEVPQNLFNFEVSLYHPDNFIKRVRNLLQPNGSIELRDPHSSSIFRFIHPGTMQFLDGHRLKIDFERKSSDDDE